MRHVLFVAFHYPPESSSSGVLRTLKYTRYLGPLGWRATVLTVNVNAYEVTDPNLEVEIPSTVRVVRTPYLNTKRHLSFRGLYPTVMAIPDRWIGWWPWAVRSGRRILREDPPNIVYSTSPPATAHLVAHSLARAAGVPWVADFRDPWHEHPPAPGTPRVNSWAARQLERMVIRRATRVIASTTRLRDTLAKRYPTESSGKFAAIPNGFDEADFSALPADDRQAGGNFVMVHAGGIAADWRDPRPLFAAIREVIDAGTIDSARLRLRFLGGGAFAASSAIRVALEATNLSANVEFLPRLPYRAALSELASADLLLLLQASPDTVDLVPAKLFEYLRSGRPVLALVQPGASSEVLSAVGGGWVVDPDNRIGLRVAISTAWQAWCDRTLRDHAARPDDLQVFSRERLAAELAGHFDTLVDETLR